MKKEFTPWQRMALAYPHDVDIADEPDPVCMHLPAKGRSVILTCDIDTETTQAYGGPVWHVSVWPPSRPRAEAVLAGVGERELFVEPGVHFENSASAPANDNGRNEATGQYRTVTSVQQMLIRG